MFSNENKWWFWLQCQIIAKRWVWWALIWNSSPVIPRNKWVHYFKLEKYSCESDSWQHAIHWSRKTLKYLYQSLSLDSVTLLSYSRGDAQLLCAQHFLQCSPGCLCSVWADSTEHVTNIAKTQGSHSCGEHVLCASVAFRTIKTCHDMGKAVKEDLLDSCVTLDADASVPVTPPCLLWVGRLLLIWLLESMKLHKVNGTLEERGGRIEDMQSSYHLQANGSRGKEVSHSRIPPEGKAGVEKPIQW